MKKTNLASTMINNLKQMIINGDFPVDSTIPPVRKLHEKYGVSKNIVLDSLKVLAEEGVIAKNGASRHGFKVIRKPVLHQNDLINDELSKVKFILPFNPWNYVGNKLLESLESIFSRNNTSIILSNNKNSILEEKKILESIHISGTEIPDALLLVTSCSFNNPNIKKLGKLLSRTPIILVDRYIQGFDCHYIGINNRDVGFRATEYLIKKGHKNIAFISGLPNLSTVYDRYLGYRTALEYSSISFNENSVFIKEGLFESYPIIENDIELIGSQIISSLNRPSAIVCGFDKVAVGLIRYFLKEGLKIPDDISIIGCDHDLTLSSHAPIKPTTFEYPYQLIVNEVYNVLNAIKNESPMAKKNVEYTALFVEGESA